MFDPSATHIIILLIVVLLLFGSKRLPGAAKSLGQSMHIFKKSVAGLNADDEQPTANPGFTASQVNQPPALPFAQPAQPADPQSQQIQDLQRQVQELQQQAAGGNAGQPGQPL